MTPAGQSSWEDASLLRRPAGRRSADVSARGPVNQCMRAGPFTDKNGLDLRETQHCSDDFEEHHFGVDTRHLHRQIVALSSPELKWTKPPETYSAKSPE